MAAFAGVLEKAGFADVEVELGSERLAGGVYTVVVPHPGALVAVLLEAGAVYKGVVV